MIVGEPFASFVLEHHPERSQPLSRDQAVRLLEQERDRGHVHHAFFKDAMLGRFYAICNCCSCCCGAIQLVRSGSPMITSSGYLAHIDESRCIGCASCHEVCNFDALLIEDGVTTILDTKCMGCGICVESCLEGALWLEREPAKGAPLELVNLMDAAVATQG
jgi:ferredoxin